MKNILYTVFLFLAIIVHGYAFGSAKEVAMAPVTVTASRINISDGTGNDRSTDTDDNLAFKHSLLDPRERGPNGIQEDVSIRGATFEQSLILLDGVRINDPQTGHFNMDIPLTRLDVKNAGIVYGSSSAYYGSSGVGGSVNIVPLPLSEKTSFNFLGETGQYDFLDGAVSLNLPVSISKNRFSFESARSSGYMPETEFSKLISSFTSNIELGGASAEILLGWMKKDFGAANFYSDIYPNEEEHTETRFGKMSLDYEQRGVTLKPVVYYRRHWDKFVLDRNREDWSKNTHTNDTYGMEFGFGINGPYGRLVYGLDVARDRIDSTNLMKHTRDRQAFFLENELELGKASMNLGARLDHYSSFGYEFNPSLSAGYFIKDDVKIRVSAGRAFRAPSFTELYYSTPANAGNPDLKPEHSWSYDTGADFYGQYFKFAGTVFLRYTSDMIDWTRTAPSKVWIASNIGEFNVYGVENVLKLDAKALEIPHFRDLEFKYSYIEAFEHKAITSKYVLNYLMHNFIARAGYELGYGLNQNITFSFKRQNGNEHYFLIDTMVYKDIKLKGAFARIYFSGENLTNTGYTENAGVKMPGIWIKAGIKIEM